MDVAGMIVDLQGKENVVVVCVTEYCRTMIDLIHETSVLLKRHTLEKIVKILSSFYCYKQHFLISILPTNEDDQLALFSSAYYPCP